MAGISVNRGVARVLASATGVAALAVAGVVVGGVVTAPMAMADPPCKAGTSQVVNPTTIRVCNISGVWVVTPCTPQKPVAHTLTATKAKCLPVS